MRLPYDSVPECPGARQFGITNASRASCSSPPSCGPSRSLAQKQADSYAGESTRVLSGRRVPMSCMIECSPYRPTRDRTRETPYKECCFQSKVLSAQRSSRSWLRFQAESVPSVPLQCRARRMQSNGFRSSRATRLTTRDCGMRLSPENDEPRLRRTDVSSGGLIRLRAVRAGEGRRGRRTNQRQPLYTM